MNNKLVLSYDEHRSLVHRRTFGQRLTFSTKASSLGLDCMSAAAERFV
jgi:hypothetical protein